MELKLIESLLDKYFEGETSIAEEKQLKAYFRAPGVAQHLEQYRPLFGYFEQQEQTQHFDKTIPLKPGKRKIRVAWLSVAASVVVMFGMFMFLNNNEPSQAELGTYDDPEIAFQETQKALNMLSKNVNVGVTGMSYIKEYEKSKEKVFKD
jgi:hypothetical protein